MGQLDVRKDLGQMLLDSGAITKEQLRQARAAMVNQEKPIGRVLMDMDLITDEAKVSLLHEKFGYEVVSIADMQVSRDILDRVLFAYAEKHRCAPILIEDNRLVVAMEDPTDILVLDEIETQSGLLPQPVLAPLEQIEAILDQYPHLTDAQTNALRLGKPRPLWWRIAHPLLFLILMLLPLAAFWVGVEYDDSFNQAVFGAMRDSAFDIVLYLISGWIVWALLLWEVDALLLGQKSKKP